MNSRSYQNKNFSQYRKRILLAADATTFQQMGLLEVKELNFVSSLRLASD